MAITFKRLNKVNLNDDVDDIYIINRARRRKYAPWPYDNDEERDNEMYDLGGEPKKREYENIYQMQRLKDMSTGRIQKALKKDHLLMRFNSDEE